LRQNKEHDQIHDSELILSSLGDAPCKTLSDLLRHEATTCLPRRTGEDPVRPYGA